jgi:ubiquinone/menaquinone biosynthesis C-methylase UbiE
VPRSVSAIDIHLMPGSYCEEYAADDPTMGAVYEQRLAVSTFGLFGPDLDDIGQSIARFIARRHPHFRPLRILDLGCTVGHNTAAWKRVFPQAEVVGIDVAAPCLRYAALRARARGLPLRFEQMNAEALAFPDASFDVVFSSMFLHEVPPRGIARVLREAHRVLRPGGLMLHMELPPADQLGAFESFYLDWDGHYNNEPYYRGFRAMNLPQLCRSAGFAAADYLQHVVPSWHALGARAWNAAVDATDAPVDSAQTGRLASGVRWFCFGAWKGEASRRGRR